MAKKPEAAQVNEAAFLKALNKNKQAAKVAAKAERPAGVLDDAAILNKLGLTAANDRISVTARVTKVQRGFAKKDTNRPFFRFAYSLTDNSPNSGTGKGTIVSNYHELSVGEKDGEVFRTIEEAYEQLFYEFQGLGEDTRPLEKDDNVVQKLIDMSNKHTKDKTAVMLTISAYEKRNGTLGMNVTPNPLVVDNSDLGEDDTSSDEDDEFNGEDWIGNWVTWTDSEGSVEIKVTSYNEEAGTFDGEDEEGNVYSDAPIDECEWMDPQPE